jgi:carbonic anhydrase
MNQRKKIGPTLLVILFLSALAPLVLAAGAAAPGLSADEALKLLKDGNCRFKEGRAIHPRQDAARRALTFGQGQHPFAAVLSCADSRVPVETIFDQGIGDLFVVRVAGNVAATDELGSLEYAVDSLGVPLVVVLGHSKCGAVIAVVEGAKLPGNLGPLLAPIKPAVSKAREENPGAAAEALIDAAIRNNVFQGMEDVLRLSPVIKAKVKAGEVKLMGAIYELDTGEVQWLGPHPDQEKLLSGKAPVKARKKGKQPEE